MTESSSENPKKPRRQHSPSAATIIKAALAAGGTVTFENGVTTVKPADKIQGTDRANEVESWFEKHAH